MRLQSEAVRRKTKTDDPVAAMAALRELKVWRSQTELRPKVPTR
jgi:hypothetical protein